jgi:hypothetical protein
MDKTLKELRVAKRVLGIFLILSPFIAFQVWLITMGIWYVLLLALGISAIVFSVISIGIKMVCLK